MAVAAVAKPPPRMTLSEWAEVPLRAGRRLGQPGALAQRPVPVPGRGHGLPRPEASGRDRHVLQVGPGRRHRSHDQLARRDRPHLAGADAAVQPTVDTAQDWVREKLAPTIRATPAELCERIAEQKSRDGVSTTLFKSFRGGYWVLTGANSSAKLVEVDQERRQGRMGPLARGRRRAGRPDSLVNARQTSYHASAGRSRCRSARRRTPRARASSMRMRPATSAATSCRARNAATSRSCGSVRRTPTARRAEVRQPRAEPGATAVYICEAERLRHRALAEARHARARPVDRSTLPPEQRAGRQPSFHINALYSPVTTWRKMVEAFLAAKDDPQKLKAFTNLWLGEPGKRRARRPRSSA
jgi:phage terminase large subunit GpA-like protein